MTTYDRHGIGRAKGWIDEKAGRVRDGIQVGRDRFAGVTDRLVDYTRDQPVRALLIAAAVGVGVSGVVAFLIGRSDE